MALLACRARENLGHDSRPDERKQVPAGDVARVVTEVDYRDDADHARKQTARDRRDPEQAPGHHDEERERERHEEGGVTARKRVLRQDSRRLSAERIEASQGELQKLRRRHSRRHEQPGGDRTRVPAADEPVADDGRGEEPEHSGALDSRPGQIRRDVQPPPGGRIAVQRRVEVACAQRVGAASGRGAECDGIEAGQ